MSLPPPRNLKIFRVSPPLARGTLRNSGPDISQIENLWPIIKRRIEKKKPRNIKELEIFIIEEWNKIDSQIIMNLMNSTDSRLKAVIEAKDERINY
jgi:hypothetical protein